MSLKHVFENQYVKHEGLIFIGDCSVQKINKIYKNFSFHYFSFGTYDKYERHSKFNSYHVIRIK